MGLSTLHISPFAPKVGAGDYREYFLKHNAHLSLREKEYVSVAGEWAPASGVYLYEPNEAYAEVSVGGSLVTVKPERPDGPNVGVVGAERGIVTGYSSGSRRRLMRMIASTKRAERPIFVTLTYPDIFPDDPDKWKRDVDVFGKRFRRLFDKGSFVWRIEFKERKSGSRKGSIAPHFHLLVWGVDILSLREWAGKAWFDLVGSGDGKHLLAGASCERMKSWNGTIRYVSKYIAKEAEFPSFWSGRAWGVVARENIPFGVKVIIPLANLIAVRAVRMGRKMIGSRGKVLTFGLTWIMNAERMMDYLEHEMEFE